MNKIFLIDGHAQIFRMYYAFMRHPLINSKGADTSILFGFTKMLLELINKEHPTHIAVAFDVHGETFRHKVYKDYKANRPPAPELVHQALEPLQEILKALNIPSIGIQGFEADDVIGSMAKQWANENNQVYMVTPDKDYGQLIDQNIFQYKLPKGGNGEVEIIGVKEICAHYGISSPDKVIDILTIWGDSSDNIPGIKGIGEVGAKKLIGQYGSLDNMLAHVEELSPKQQENIKNSLEQIEMSRFLVTINTKIQLPVNEEDIQMSLPDKNAVDQVFAKYEFNSLKKMIAAFGQSQPATPACGSITAPLTNEGTEILEDYPEDNPQQGIPCIKPETESRFAAQAAKNKCLAVEIVENEFVFSTLADDSSPSAPKGIFYSTGSIGGEMAALLCDSSICKIGYDLKNIIKAVPEKIATDSQLYDIQLLHYLLDSEVSHAPEFILKEQFGIDFQMLGAQQEEEQSADLFSTPALPADNSQRLEIAAKTGILFIYLKDTLLHKLDELGHASLYTNIEMPLIPVLASMELAGVKIDTAQLKEYSKELTEQMNKIEKMARELAADPSINLSSPKQIGILLFEKLKVDPNVKKSVRGNYSTDEQTLRAIENTHPIIGEILEYRNLKKLLSTYIDALPLLIDAHDKKVHTTFNQALTSTGRLSSYNPNLQNIPIRTERGREIRKAFISSFTDGYIVSADYSQIELRLMAHLSRDKDLIEAFLSGKDIHSATAAKLFGVDIEEVTDEYRRKAKTVNFGIIYGISAFGLSERMGIGVREAKEFIEAYFKTYPGVSNYISSSIERARKEGYVETIYGRRRYLKDINSRNQNVRKFNERNAVNAPLQGSAADIIKIAMCKTAQRIEREQLKSRMILQVHDELVFDTHPAELEEVMSIARQEMENVAKLEVPLIVDCGYGKNWLEAH